MKTLLLLVSLLAAEAVASASADENNDPEGGGGGGGGIYRIGSELECRDEALLAKMDLGECDQQKDAVIVYDTLQGNSGKETFAGPECTGRCLIEFHRQKIHEWNAAPPPEDGAGVLDPQTTGLRIITREDCRDVDLLRSVRISRNTCLLLVGHRMILPAGNGYYDPEEAGSGDGERDDVDDDFDEDDDGRGIYVYSGSRFSSHTLYIFFILLIIACSCCGGFFRCRRPNAPDLYSYLEARSLRFNGRRRREGDEYGPAGQAAAAASSECGVIIDGDEQASVPMSAAIPTYEEAVAAGKNASGAPAAAAIDEDELEDLRPSLPPSYAEAISEAAASREERNDAVMTTTTVRENGGGGGDRNPV